MNNSTTLRDWIYYLKEKDELATIKKKCQLNMRLPQLPKN